MNRSEFERRKKGLNISAVAIKAGLRPHVVAAAEEGVATEETLERLAHALLVFPPQVLLREVHPKREPEELALSNGGEEAGQV